MLSLTLAVAAYVLGPPTASPTREQRAGVVQARASNQWAKRLPDEVPLGVGSVVCAVGSFDHYFSESLVLIIEHSDDEGTVGVLLNHQTPWTINDMTGGAEAMSAFGANEVFLGGDAGRDTMIMVHGQSLLEGARRLTAEDQAPICVGGVQEAAQLVAAGQLQPDKFKFFYKTVEWLPHALQREREDGVFEHVKLSPALLLQQSGQKSMWAQVRALMREHEAKLAAEGGGSPSSGDGVPYIDPATLPATRYAPAATIVDPRHAAKPAPSAAPSAQTPAASTPTSTSSAGEQTSSTGGETAAAEAHSIADVLEYRTFKGNEQWRVLWSGFKAEEEAGCSWELQAVVELKGGEAARRRAEELRSAAELRRV